MKGLSFGGSAPKATAAPAAAANTLEWSRTSSECKWAAEASSLLRAASNAAPEAPCAIPYEPGSKAQHTVRLTTTVTSVLLEPIEMLKSNRLRKKNQDCRSNHTSLQPMLGLGKPAMLPRGCDVGVMATVNVTSNRRSRVSAHALEREALN